LSLERLYLDYNATSPLAPSVKEWLARGDFQFGNPSSQHTSGKLALKKIHESTEYIKTIFKVPSDFEIVYHSGVSEYINTSVLLFIEETIKNNKKPVLIFSPIDHACVTNQVTRFSKNIQLTMDQDGVIDFILSEKTIRENYDPKTETALLIISKMHNELGIINDLDWILKIKNELGITTHIDCAQMVGKMQSWMNLNFANDLFSFSGHKFGALKGVGFSFVRKKLFKNALILGGDQQKNLRSGTMNVMGIESLSLALKDNEKINIEVVVALKKKIEVVLKSKLEAQGFIVSEKVPRNNNTIYFVYKTHKSDVVLALFDQFGLEVSAGSACSSGSLKDSHVLMNIGFPEFSKNGIRISLNLWDINEKCHLIIDQLSKIKI
jgi:cysteine desulfurase